MNNLCNLYIKGECKFDKEYQYAKHKLETVGSVTLPRKENYFTNKLGSNGVEILLNHVINDSGVGEPDESQEIIEEQHDPTV